MEMRSLDHWMAGEVLPFYSKYGGSKGFPGGSAVKNLLAMQETQVQSLGWEALQEKETATYSSILAGDPHGTWKATVHEISKSWTQLSD